MESLGMRRGLYKVIRQPGIAIIALISHEEGKKTPTFLQRNVHLKDQRASGKVTIDSFQGELGLPRVIKTSNKRLASCRKNKRKWKEKVGHPTGRGRTEIKIMSVWS